MKMDTDHFFRLWAGEALGHGYGTGEVYTFKALQDFFKVPTGGHANRLYNYNILEEQLTPTVAWLMIQILCRMDILEYGVSPRFPWLTEEGLALKEFVLSHSVEELYDIVLLADGQEFSDDPWGDCGGSCECHRQLGGCKNPFFSKARRIAADKEFILFTEKLGEKWAKDGTL